ncbi:MAG: Crp/Fnr family transcriptional regulator [Arcicella sp.]|nr:Crp/Fnr family transcriptional regulator [Arcicella sp.]
MALYGYSRNLCHLFLFQWLPMNKHQYLTEIISKSVSLSERDIKLCQLYFEPLSIPRNTVLDEQTKTPEYLYFISSGYMRLFYYDQNGDEQTTFVCSPNGFITPFLSFIHQTQASENVECITDCDIFRITNNNLKKLIDESESFKAFSLIIFEQAMASTAQRANDLATLSAEQRYKKLMANQPLLIQNIPIQYIASYLGMKPESLSRIRRQIFS